MNDYLAQILADKADEIRRLEADIGFAEMTRRALAATPPRGFERALRAASGGPVFPVIAEIKKASPSRGLIRADFDPQMLAQSYQRGGAACLSVLTDGPGFQGTEADFRAARAAVDRPVLRKDFMLAPIQILESRAMGADCILLIMAILTAAQAAALRALAHDLGMDVLAECHDEAEIARAQLLPKTMIGINNRNLRSFETSLATTARLAPLVEPGRLIVAESGIATADDFTRLWGDGARAFLIGETLMRARDPGALLAEIARTGD